MTFHWIDRAASIGSPLRRARWLPWRTRHRGGPLNTLLLIHLRRRLLLQKARTILASGDRSVTVIYGARDRGGNRLRRSISSVRCQTVPTSDVRIVVVDYGSSSRSREELSAICDEGGATLLRVPAASEWNRAHCMNIALRRCDTPFFLALDVDMLLPPDYLSRCIELLYDDPLQVIYAPTLDLDQAGTEELADPVKCLDDNAWAHIFEHTEPRLNGRLGLGLPLTFTHYVNRIRGFDERYRLWGLEDDDLARRFDWLGLTRRRFPEHGLVHQYHEKHAGVSDHPHFDTIVASNRARWRRADTILRNDDGWGGISAQNLNGS